MHCFSPRGMEQTDNEWTDRLQHPLMAHTPSVAGGGGGIIRLGKTHNTNTKEVTHYSTLTNSPWTVKLSWPGCKLVSGNVQGIFHGKCVGRTVSLVQKYGQDCQGRNVHGNVLRKMSRRNGVMSGSPCWITSLCVADVICVTLVNTHTDTVRHTEDR